MTANSLKLIIRLSLVLMMLISINEIYQFVDTQRFIPPSPHSGWVVATAQTFVLFVIFELLVKSWKKKI